MRPSAAADAGGAHQDATVDDDLSLAGVPNVWSLAWRVSQQRRAWPLAKLRARGLHKLLGTIQYPGSKTT